MQVAVESTAAFHSKRAASDRQKASEEIGRGKKVAMDDR